MVIGRAEALHGFLARKRLDGPTDLLVAGRFLEVEDDDRAAGEVDAQRQAT
jgi:hypothetical protein